MKTSTAEVVLRSVAAVAGYVVGIVDDRADRDLGREHGWEHGWRVHCWPGICSKLSVIWEVPRIRDLKVSTVF